MRVRMKKNLLSFKCKVFVVDNGRKIELPKLVHFEDCLDTNLKALIIVCII